MAVCSFWRIMMNYFRWIFCTEVKLASVGKTIEAAYIANIIVIHSRLAQRAETVDHTISILISTLQKPEAASEFPVDFAPIHC